MNQAACLVMVLVMGQTLQGQEAAIPDARIRPMVFALDNALVRDVGVCADGGFVVVGSFSSTTDFDPGPGRVQRTAVANDGFVARYGRGGSCRWVAQIRTGGRGQVAHVLVQRADVFCVWGDALGPVTLGAGADEQTLAGSGPTSFLARFDDNGSLRSVRKLPVMVSIERASFLDPPRFALGPSSEFVLGGFQLHRTGIPERERGFVVSIGEDGREIWKKTGFTAGVTSVARDSKGRILVAGLLLGENPRERKIGLRLACLAAAGADVWRHEFATRDGMGIGYPQIVADDKGTFAMSAFLDGTVDLDPGPGVHEVTANRGMVLARFDGGGRVINAFSIDNRGGTIFPAAGLAADGIGDLYVCASFNGTIDMDPSAEERLLVSKPGLGFDDFFVAKYNPSGKLIWLRSGKVEAEENQSGRDNFLAGIAVDPQGRQVVVRGRFGNNLVLEGGPKIRNSSGGYHGVILRLDGRGAAR